jgi:hypothetical protein
MAAIATASSPTMNGSGVFLLAALKMRLTLAARGGVGVGAAAVGRGGGGGAGGRVVRRGGVSAADRPSHSSVTEVAIQLISIRLFPRSGA